MDAPALEVNENATSGARQGILGRLDIDKWRSSSKIEALVEELTNLRRQDATTKSLVFSQFVNFLDLIAFRLQRAGFVVRHLRELASFRQLTKVGGIDLSVGGNNVASSERRDHQTLQ